MKRNPIPTATDYCEICGKPYASLHEVFFGTANRKKSIQHGMQIRLCYEHHNMPNGNNPHFNVDVDLKIRKAYQSLFEHRAIEQGMPADEARAYFMMEFGRNFIMEDSDGETD